MTSRENVVRAIERRAPGYVPTMITHADVMNGDMITVMAAAPLSFVPDVPHRSEWGFILAPHEGTMGQPSDEPFLNGWDGFESFVPPDPTDPSRYRMLSEGREKAEASGKYLICNLGITGFNLATFIRGFNGFLEDLYIDREPVMKLLDMVFDFEKQMIREFCSRGGVDGFMFFDDWGAQDRLLIHPDLFRELFKHRYQEQFDLIHSFGKHVIFHSCGYVYDIIPDLIEVGADVINLNQPDLFGVEKMGADFAGKVCFLCPADHQTTAISGDKKALFDYVDRLYKNLNVFDGNGCLNGGLIGLVEDYGIMGMSQDNYHHIQEAFFRYKTSKGV